MSEIVALFLFLIVSAIVLATVNRIATTIDRAIQLRETSIKERHPPQAQIHQIRQGGTLDLNREFFDGSSSDIDDADFTVSPTKPRGGSSRS